MDWDEVTLYRANVGELASYLVERRLNVKGELHVGRCFMLLHSVHVILDRRSGRAAFGFTRWNDLDLECHRRELQKGA